MDVIQVPARVPRRLIDEVRKKMKANGLNWAALITFLFNAYLDGKIKIDVMKSKS